MSRHALFASLAWAALTAWAFLSSGCGDSEEVAPSASIVEVAPDSLDPARDDADDLTIRVEYADGDADLGGGTASIHDCRSDGLVAQLAIPPIASEEAVAKGVPIEGILDLIVNDVGWVEPAGAAPPACAEQGAPAPQAESAVFCVVLTDIAGHAGAGDCTSPVAIAAP